LPGFGPAAEVLLFRQKDPKAFTPSSALSYRADVIYGVADQLALLKQAPPNYLNVNTFCRAEGVGDELFGKVQLKMQPAERDGF
jgi:hypothetical protein